MDVRSNDVRKARRSWSGDYTGKLRRQQQGAQNSVTLTPTPTRYMEDSLTTIISRVPEFFGSWIAVNLFEPPADSHHQVFPHRRYSRTEGIPVQKVFPDRRCNPAQSRDASLLPGEQGSRDALFKTLPPFSTAYE